MAGTESTPTDAAAPVDAPISVDDDAKEFDAAFEEFAAVDDTETTPPPDPAEKPADAPAPADGPEEPAKTVEDPPAAPEGAAPDIWAAATPEQRTAFQAVQQENQAAQQENRSHRGRASFLDIQEAQQNAVQPPAASPAAGPAAAADADAPATDEQFTNFESDYPEVAGPIKARYDPRYDAQEAKITALERRLSGISDVQMNEAIGGELTVLEQRHPTWHAMTSTPEFETWVNAQPRYVQEGFVRNGNIVVDGEEAASLIDLYVDQQKAPAADDANPAVEDKSTGKATRRQRRLESAVSAETSQAGPGSGPPEGDFDAAFDHFARQP